MSLLAAAALLTGCSTSSEELPPAPENGLYNPSETTIETTPAEVIDAAAVEVVVVPESITQRPDYVPLPLEEVSGNVLETEHDTTLFFDAYQGAELRQWVQDLTNAGWVQHEHEIVDTETAYNTYLTKDGQSIAVYSNSANDNQNTSISFSK